MARLFRSTVIDAPLARVWPVIRDFRGLSDWHPAFADCVIEDGVPGDRVGCVRRFELADGGGTLREQLLALDDQRKLLAYTILSSPVPITNYVSVMRVVSVTDGDRSFLRWSCDFDVKPEDAAAMEDLLGNGVYQGGFDALKAMLAG
ncbi:MAG: SRPBCC family protein [Azospirillum sp.]|nr:SRPBCC family protein [Azospirillum sp.]